MWNKRLLMDPPTCRESRTCSTWVLKIEVLGFLAAHLAPAANLAQAPAWKERKPLGVMIDSRTFSLQPLLLHRVSSMRLRRR